MQPRSCLHPRGSCSRPGIAAAPARTSKLHRISSSRNRAGRASRGRGACPAAPAGRQRGCGRRGRAETLRPLARGFAPAQRDWTGRRVSKCGSESAGQRVTQVNQVKPEAAYHQETNAAYQGLGDAGLRLHCTCASLNRWPGKYTSAPAGLAAHPATWRCASPPQSLPHLRFAGPVALASRTEEDSARDGGTLRRAAAHET